jgi:fructosamine-3-kinase
VSELDPTFAALSKAFGQSIRGAEPVEGGNIARSWRVELNNRRTIFVKTGYPTAAHYAAEADGLRELAKCRAIRVPEVLAAGEDFLALEFISRGRMARNFSETLGRGLAELHRVSAGSFGFRSDNFIGATAQRNSPPLPREKGWGAFYWEYRLLPQWKLAEKNGLPDSRSMKMFGLLENRIDHWLGPVGEPPVLLHGDLWGGNAITDANGDPVLIDPAVYYGHRETDLAMMKLFGGIPDRAFKAYQEIHPLTRGAEERMGLYQLYHLLNHWNLFGQSYADQVMAMLNRYAR